MPDTPDFDPAHTTIADLLAFYETRYDHKVGWGERPALVIIDFSVAFTRGTENFPGGGYDAQVGRTATLLATARQAGVPVVYTTIAYDPDMRDAGLWVCKIPWITGLQKGTVEVAIDDRLAPRADEPVVVKKYPSIFFQTDLDRMLRDRGVDSLIVAGCTTSCCVRASVMDAMALGYRTVIAEDAVGDMNQMLHLVNLADLRSRFADVARVDEIVARLETISSQSAA